MYLPTTTASVKAREEGRNVVSYHLSTPPRLLSSPKLTLVMALCAVQPLSVSPPITYRNAREPMSATTEEWPQRAGASDREKERGTRVALWMEMPPYSST